MNFLVMGYDGSDPDALSRRMAARPAHIEMGTRMAASGGQLLGIALLNEEQERMIGSAILCDFPSRSELDAWLAEEPYVLGKVWERIEIFPCRVGPSFEQNLARLKREA